MTHTSNQTFRVKAFSLNNFSLFQKPVKLFSRLSEKNIRFTLFLTYIFQIIFYLSNVKYYFTIGKNIYYYRILIKFNQNMPSLNENI